MKPKDLSSQSSRKEYALSQVAEFKASHPNLDVKLLKATPPSKLKNVNLSDKRMAQLGFDPVVLSVLCGSIFSDASIAINKNYANARIQMRDSTRQTEWFMWKVLCVFSTFVKPTGIVFQNPDGFQANSPKADGEVLGKWKISSSATTELTALYTIICDQGKKKMQRFWLNHMNDHFLMTLWLDDGGLVGGRQGVIAYYAVPEAELKVFTDYMLAVWDIKCNVVAAPSRATKTNPKPYQINIADLDNLEKLLRIIAPIVPVKSMLYKICLYPIESSRLQRWTSELKTLVRQDWHDDIDQIYADLSSSANAQKKI